MNHNQVMCDLFNNASKFQTHGMNSQRGHAIFLLSNEYFAYVLYGLDFGCLDPYKEFRKTRTTIHLTLTWFDRLMYSKYIDESCDLAWDIYSSFYKRFVSGGEGEGRIPLTFKFK